MRINKLFYWFLIASLLGGLCYTGVKAADMKTTSDGASNVEVTAEETMRNLFIASETVSVKAKEIKKDLFAAGQTVDIDSQIEHNVFAAGNNVTISGTIGGNVFAAGNILSINGKIDGDLFLAGAKVIIEKDTELTGTIYAVGGEVKILGKVMGDVNVSGGMVTIGGTITGKTNITADSTLTIGKTAVIENLKYQSPKEAIMENGAIVTKQEYTPTPKNPQKGIGTRGKQPFGFPVISFLSSLALAFLLVYLFKKPCRLVLEESIKNIGSSIGIGFAVLLVSPIALLIIAITLVGGKIALVFGLLYLLFLVLGSAFAGLLIGTWMVKLIKKEEEVPMDWITVLIGVSLFTLLNWLPFVGWFIKFALVLVGFGSLCKIFVQSINHQ